MRDAALSGHTTSSNEASTAFYEEGWMEPGGHFCVGKMGKILYSNMTSSRKATDVPRWAAMFPGKFQELLLNPMKDRRKNDTAPAATHPAYVHTLGCRYFGLMMEEENVVCCADFFPVASRSRRRKIQVD
jgi:hypothetical protein